MADTKPADKAAEAKPAAKSAGRTPAGEATDPQVHQLLAEMETARLNGDTKAREDAIKKLNDLGYDAG